MAASDVSQKAFEAAKKAFKKDLRDDSLYEDILRTDSIDKLFEAIEKLQRNQDAERRVRRLSKMKNILDKLQGFNSAVDTYAQVKPEIMGLVWGSIRVLLVLTDNVAKYADAVITAMEDISDALPFFTDVAKIFDDDGKFRDKLALFYGDILQFYIIALNFFNMSRWKLVFEAVWPKQRAKIALLVTHIERHTSSMRNEMTFSHLREEHDLRVKALTRFDQETEFQDQQKFHALRGRVNPQCYNDRLDWLLNRLSSGSVKWLQYDSAFLSWLEISKTTAQLLWLQGIPGAGKTYLAAAAIKEAEARHQTLFAFPSHMDRSSTTAKSILQSLLFQLASHVKDIRAMLVELDERDLTRSTSKVAEILKKGLKTAGPTYIILDGLDEMDGDERRMLLEQLCALEECTQARVMVSSRAEDDLGKLLTSKAASIFVHRNNSASIQSYVNRRIQAWMDTADFAQPARKKIWHMLAPLAANAEGMFLYARIVLDNAELLTNLEEIEQELKVLPKNLDDVYYRIFARIQGLSPALQRKAKRIFNWIACAPVLMTRYEMEQLLDIDSTEDAAPSTMNSINFVGICGSAVEVVDETPRFVHFTVSEYIFSRQVADFGNQAEANLSLATSTLKYLCSGIFDESLSDRQVEQNILVGKYRLHWFAFTQWISPITSCLEESSDLSAYPGLREMLCRLALELRNYRFKGTISLNHCSIFQKLESEWPEIVHILCGVLQFRHDDEQTEWNYENQRQWTDKDPSIMSSMWARIYQQFTKLLCGQGEHLKPTCHCETLRKAYGSRIYKCWYPSCSSSRSGFVTYESRDQHMKRDNHSRPWKCPKEGCEFGTIGFSTQRDADNHWRNRHRVSNQGTTGPGGARHRDELQVLMFELTKAGDFDALQNLVLNVEVESNPYQGLTSIASPAILLAAAKGSLPMVEILIDWCGWDTGSHNKWSVSPGKKELYSAVMKGNNTDLLLWFCDRLLFANSGRDDLYGWVAGEAIATGSPDMYAAWEEFFLDPNGGLTVAYPCYSGDPIAQRNEAFRSGKWPANHQPRPQRGYSSSIWEYNKRSVLFSKSAFSAAKKNALFEARLVQTWHKLINNVLGGQSLDRDFLGCALVCLSQSGNPSISLGAELLRLGAPIDFPREAVSSSSKVKAEGTVQVVPDRKSSGRPQKGITALHYAARQTSEQASHFVRFLLEQGANPQYAWQGTRPGDEPGVALMGKWLGETWEEVVERTRGTRLEEKRIGEFKYGEFIDADEHEIIIISDDEAEVQEVGASDVDPGGARTRAPEPRVDQAAKRRRLD